MAENINSAQLNLRSTPTAGMDSEHSPYYRRLLSSGYKGFLQGVIGGASFYGTLGALIGLTVAIPLSFTGVGAMAWLAIPALALGGAFKGADTFGNIGSVAAITAESAEMNEKRRYLLDRYKELPNTPDFDDEAAQIQHMLENQFEPKNPPTMFHWQTVLICAVLGAALIGGFIWLAPQLTGIGALEPVFHLLHLSAEGVATHTAATGAIAAGAGVGALAGATIGLDRYYVRKWFDATQGVVHDGTKVEKALIAREVEVQALGRPSPVGYASEPQVDKIHVQPAAHLRTDEHSRAAPATDVLAGAQNPGTQVHTGQLDKRIADAMKVPVV